MRDDMLIRGYSSKTVGAKAQKESERARRNKGKADASSRGLREVCVDVAMAHVLDVLLMKLIV